MTQGRATYTMEFSRYEEVPPAIAEEIMAKVAGKPQGRATFTMHFSHYAELPQNLAEEVVKKVRGEK